jgi:hypothetical protein
VPPTDPGTVRVEPRYRRPGSYSKPVRPSLRLRVLNGFSEVQTHAAEYSKHAQLSDPLGSKHIGRSKVDQPSGGARTTGTSRAAEDGTSKSEDRRGVDSRQSRFHAPRTGPRFGWCSVPLTGSFRCRPASKRRADRVLPQDLRSSAAPARCRDRPLPPALRATQ